MAYNAKAALVRRVESAALAKAQRPSRPTPPVPVSTKPRPKRERPFAELVFEAHLRQIQRLVAQRGQADLRPLYEDAVAELRRRLATAPRDPTRATPTEIQAVLAQGEAVLQAFGQKLERHLQNVGKAASELGAQHAVDEFQRLQRHFTGTTPVLQLERGAVFRGLVDNVDQSLLRRYQRVTQTWTLPAIAEMERRLSVGVMTGRSWYELTNELAGANGLLEQERYKAERIVRTEGMFAHGATKFQAMRRTREDVGEQNLWKKLIETFDDRTGDDSFLVHGQAVPLEKPFEWKHRVRGSWVVTPYMHPPNRPNDRAVVIPWDPSWPEEKGFEAPLSRSELAGARPTRWRDTVGVKIPPGHRPGQPYSYKVERPKGPPESPKAPPAPPKAPPPPPAPAPPPTPVARPRTTARPEPGAWTAKPAVQAFAPAYYQTPLNAGVAPTGSFDWRGLRKTLGSMSDGFDTFNDTEQKVVRREFREVLARYGLVSTDLRSVTSRGPSTFVVFDPGAEGGLGYHSWNGKVALGPTLSEGLKAFAKGRRTPVAQAAMKCTVHEEVHGHGPVESSGYTGPGRWIEEATTEIAARKVTREQFKGVENLTPSNPGSAYTTQGGRRLNVGTYQAQIDAISHVVDRVLGTTPAGPPNLRELNLFLERVSLRFRQSQTPLRSSDEVVDGFVDAVMADDLLRGAAPSTRGTLRSELKTRLGAI